MGRNEAKYKGKKSSFSELFVPPYSLSIKHVASPYSRYPVMLASLGLVLHICTCDQQGRISAVCKKIRKLFHIHVNMMAINLFHKRSRLVLSTVVIQNEEWDRRGPPSIMPFPDPDGN